MKNDPRWKVPDPRCGAVFTARRGTCDPRALSRTFFDPALFRVFSVAAELIGLHTSVTFVFTVRVVLLFVLQPRAAPVTHSGATGELAFCAVQQICSGSASAIHRKNLSLLGQVAWCATAICRSCNSRAHLHTVSVLISTALSVVLQLT